MKKTEKGLLLKIYLDETARYEGKSLYEAIVFKARELNLAGATVKKGIMGYGSDSRIHSSKVLRLSDHLPVTIEIVDSKEKIDSILPFVDEAVVEGLVTLTEVDVMKYRFDG